MAVKKRGGSLVAWLLVCSVACLSGLAGSVAACLAGGSVGGLSGCCPAGAYRSQAKHVSLAAICTIHAICI